MPSSRWDEKMPDFVNFADQLPFFYRESFGAGRPSCRVFNLLQNLLIHSTQMQIPLRKRDLNAILSKLPFNCKKDITDNPVAPCHMTSPRPHLKIQGAVTKRRKKNFGSGCFFNKLMRLCDPV